MGQDKKSKKNNPTPAKGHNVGIRSVISSKNDSQAIPTMSINGVAFNTLFIKKRLSFYIGELFKRKIRKLGTNVLADENYLINEMNTDNISAAKEIHDQDEVMDGVVEILIDPMLQKQADMALRQENQSRLLHENEKKINVMEKMLNNVVGKSPSIPPMSIGKKPWKASMKDAAEEIINNYEADCKSESKNFRSLRDASDAFFESHEFPYKPGYTSDQLYENVKQAKSPWLKKQVKNG